MPEGGANAITEAAAVAADDVLRAAACLAVEPLALGGILVRTDRGPSCDQWLCSLQRLLAAPLVRLPPQIDDERLLGGTDLAASLQHGRLVASAGLLSQSQGRVLLLTLAERATGRLAAILSAALAPSREGIGLVALDSGRAADEGCPAPLCERLAMHIDLRPIPPRALSACMAGIESLAMTARPRTRPSAAEIGVDDTALRSLTCAALELGVDSMRVLSQALRVARVHAVLERRGAVQVEDLEFAARLVLAPRARRIPAAAADAPAQVPRQSPSEPQPSSTAAAEADDTLQRVLAAANATIPADLLRRVAPSASRLARSGSAGRAGAVVSARRRGRPIGVRPGRPRAGARLNLLATLRCAAPWQVSRRARSSAPCARMLLCADDFRITRLRQRSETAIVFLVDASGSSAMHRLAELKGAVKLLLADCYARRDLVAVIAFRGRSAELVLPPTRSLVRAKRCMAELPGGGGTPLASGLKLAQELTEQLRRRAVAPVLVLLTDGQANVTLDGAADRRAAEQQATLAAGSLRASEIRSLLIDTAPRPQPAARTLAGALHAAYVPLPHADAHALRGAVLAVA